MTEQQNKQQPFTKGMSLALQAEEAALTLVSIYFLSRYNLGLPVWLWVLLFFSPDVSMLGYLVNNRVGAIIYNIFHHRALAIALIAAGYFTHADIMLSIGLLLFAHSSFDRALGIGLKYDDGFSHTSFGWGGKTR